MKLDGRRESDNVYDRRGPNNVFDSIKRILLGVDYNTPNKNVVLEHVRGAVIYVLDRTKDVILGKKENNTPTKEQAEKTAKPSVEVSGRSRTERLVDAGVKAIKEYNEKKNTPTKGQAEKTAKPSVEASETHSRKPISILTKEAIEENNRKKAQENETTKAEQTEKTTKPSVETPTYSVGSTSEDNVKYTPRRPTLDETITMLSKESEGMDFMQQKASEGGQMEVSNIRVHDASVLLDRLNAASDNPVEITQEDLDKVDGKYLVTAIVDDVTVSHALTEAQYTKMMALDDAHRLMILDKLMGVDHKATKLVDDVHFDQGKEEKVESDNKINQTQGKGIDAAAAQQTAISNYSMSMDQQESRQQSVGVGR